MLKKFFIAAGASSALFVATLAPGLDAPRFVKTVAFEKASFEIAEKSDIERIVSWAKKHPTALGRIEGYNCAEDIKDKKSDDEKTKLLLLTAAERRANIVREMLVVKGIPKSRLTTVAFGMAEEDEPCKAQVLFTL